MNAQSDNQTPVIQHYSSVQYLPLDPEAIEKALMAGDLSKLDNKTRVKFFVELCRSTGMNPLTRPFITMQGQDGAVHWYPTVGAAEQLRKLHRVSVTILSREKTDDDLYGVTVKAWTLDGREEESQGWVATSGLKGKELANALMRAESKAKRRATLALCGLGMTLAEDAAGTEVPFDPQTGALDLPPEIPEAGRLLTAVGQWFRQRPAASREVIAQCVWGVGLHEMPHLGLEELQAGWSRLDEGRAPLAWDSMTLPEDLAQWQQAHAARAILDVFDRSDGRPEE